MTNNLNIGIQTGDTSCKNGCANKDQTIRASGAVFWPSAGFLCVQLRDLSALPTFTSVGGFMQPGDRRLERALRCHPAGARRAGARLRAAESGGSGEQQP